MDCRRTTGAGAYPTTPITTITTITNNNNNNNNDDDDDDNDNGPGSDNNPVQIFNIEPIATTISSVDFKKTIHEYNA